MISEINNNPIASSVSSDKYRDKGLTGLCNLGNTCYINSCMQILSHCYELNAILDNINLKLDEKTLLLYEWRQLKDLMWKSNCIISPNRFIGAIQYIAKKKQRELFTGYAQNDLPEFLIFLFDCFHESIERKVDINILGTPKSNIDELAKKCYAMIKNTHSNSYSEILQLFFGIHVSLIVSNNIENNIYSIVPESFSIINLPIPRANTNSSNKTYTIYDCFDLYTAYELLENENAWYNDNTKKKESVKKSIKFWSLPNILIVDFKRFDNHNRKLNNIIETPLTRLDLSKYVLGYNNKNYIYELFGICNHSGGSQGGHYTSYVKNANQKWYCFNDTSVTEINENTLISAKAYCYCYRKLV
jgi:ubiquitin carboxyl-terminal hydrolase 8